MKKYIFTESQLKKILDNTISEQKTLSESSEVYNLADLASMLARTGVDEETMLEILSDLYKQGGDEEIKKIFRTSVGVDIDDVGKGRYIIKR